MKTINRTIRLAIDLEEKEKILAGEMKLIPRFIYPSNACLYVTQNEEEVTAIPYEQIELSCIYDGSTIDAEVKGVALYPHAYQENQEPQSYHLHDEGWLVYEIEYEIENPIERKENAI